jgi:IS4 transposase
VDSTVVQLVLSCISWAKHRRRKAAAKLHLRMEVQNQLPRFAVINTAKEHDARQAAAVCSGIRSGEIVVFDRAYRDLRHLWQLTQRGVFWVTRTLASQDFRVVKRRLKEPQAHILRDDEILLQGTQSRQRYPQRLRRVLARVDLDGKAVELEFLTNNFDWQPASVADLYRCRWQIEVFFRQLKQTLQLSDFLGNSLNAVQWQLWMALLVYVLLKYLAYVCRWRRSFIRVWTTARAVVWERWDLESILRRYGTAGASLRLVGQPQQLYFPRFT